VKKLVRCLSVLEARGLHLSPRALCEDYSLTGDQAVALQRLMGAGDEEVCVCVCVLCVSVCVCVLCVCV